MQSKVKHQQRVHHTRNALLKMVRTRGPGIKLPTFQEMCTDLAVTRTQLEQALSSLEAGGLILRRHGSGIYGTERVAQKTIGVVFGGDIFGKDFSPFWSLLLQAVREQAGDRQFRPRAYLDISDSAGGLDGHEQLVEDLEAHRLDGLLLLAPAFDHDEAAELRAHGVPQVVFGGNAPADWSVTIDWSPFLKRVADELVPTGCQRVGVLAQLAQRAELEEVLRAAGRHDIQTDDWSYETWAPTIPGAGTRENCARRLTEQMLAGHATNPLPDTLVSLDDTATRGVITALAAAGLRPGRDIRIVTAENKGSPVLEPWPAELTRLEFDPQAWVKAALEMLATLMDGRTPAVNPVRVAPAVNPVRVAPAGWAEQRV